MVSRQLKRGFSGFMVALVILWDQTPTTQVVHADLYDLQVIGLEPAVNLRVINQL